MLEVTASFYYYMHDMYYACMFYRFRSHTNVYLLHFERKSKDISVVIRGIRYMYCLRKIVYS